jgi:hypothetical protein
MTVDKYNMIRGRRRREVIQWKILQEGEHVTHEEERNEVPGRRRVQEGPAHDHTNYGQYFRVLSGSVWPREIIDEFLQISVLHKDCHCIES